ncbi:putative F-box/LRR-repeat protein At5g54820 isoform X2 [Amaranthus tricolor]|uniref:putative F-box/LRR-repeat protein At5g54820 isoform X2 n=1 Tax=Amaranthus tricolor TaxID=29722 RepID=UPI00258FBDCA|nr:putative F-box/LRR-repeat protein At5g54820 isoform X2 [Amaranthus tricolor]XP_057531173.1 putative F-box/LRR-repeat protein At5g54820 isoform X2 [Amaranthus tricolor]
MCGMPSSCSCTRITKGRSLKFTEFAPMDHLQWGLKRSRTSAALPYKTQPDYISDLPDEILIKIIDKLPMKEAMDTSLLSKRWNGLWKCKRTFELVYKWFNRNGIKVFPVWSRIFSVLQEQDIHFLSVSLRYVQSMSAEIDLLFTYASMKNVEELYIDFNGTNDNNISCRRRYPSFSLTECEECICLSLVKLSLKSVQLEMFPARFVVLKELFLERVKLSANSVQIITSKCPLLVLLCLCNCNPKTNLRIDIAASSKLIQLIIREDVIEVSNTSELFIRAANVKAIEFGLALPRKRYHIEGALVCSEATFRLNQMDRSRQAMKVTDFGIKGSYSNNFLGLLKKLRAAEVLTLCSWCIQVISIELLIQFRNPVSNDLNLRHLTLETGLGRWEFLGTAYLLLKCKKLENLVMVMGDQAEIIYGCVRTKSHHRKFDMIMEGLPALKTVEFKNFSGNYQLWEADNFNEKEFFNNMEIRNPGCLLVWNIKVFAYNLEKIIYRTAKKQFVTKQFERFRLPKNFEFPDCLAWGHV